MPYRPNQGGPLTTQSPRPESEPAKSQAERIAAHFEFQALACAALGSQLYADLLNRAVEDFRSGGPVAALLHGYTGNPNGTAVSFRVLGGVQALVLTGQAPELAKFYPSAGGTADPGPGASLAWAAFRRVLEEHADQVKGWLDLPVQTNEVGRGAALVGALCQLVAEADLPIRLVEIGTSAGLNLRADKFHITGDGASYGPADSPVQLTDGWQGTPPPPANLRVVSRIGGDLAPVDPVSPEGRLRLSSFVWADQVERFTRLSGACDLAAQVPAELRQESAAETIARTSLEEGTWTVLWHSIMWQYLSIAQQIELNEAIEALGASATPRARFAHVYLELIRATADTPVELVTWPGEHRRQLGTAPPHGVPVTWI
ncbi:MAG TPA: DUF2332 domain-containing protein [Streptosporangiaceae bacterium]|nr:DUF2332 domain-containing protein [Streptosporangiaceae bacterium]